MRVPPAPAVSMANNHISNQAVHVKGNILKPKILLFNILFNYLSDSAQDELTATMLAAAQLPEQKQMLGERLFPVIENMYPHLAGKITGMLLEIDNSELLHMLDHTESLHAKVEEAIAVLQVHQAGTAIPADKLE